MDKINCNFEAGTLEFRDKAGPKWDVSSWLLSQNALQTALPPSFLLGAEWLWLEVYICGQVYSEHLEVTVSQGTERLEFESHLPLSQCTPGHLALHVNTGFSLLLWSPSLQDEKVLPCASWSLYPSCSESRHLFSTAQQLLRIAQLCRNF